MPKRITSSVPLDNRHHKHQKDYPEDIYFPQQRQYHEPVQPVVIHGYGTNIEPTFLYPSTHFIPGHVPGVVNFIPEHHISHNTSGANYIPDSISYIPVDMQSVDINRTEIQQQHSTVMTPMVPIKNAGFISLLYIDGYSLLDEPDEFEFEANKTFFSRIVSLIELGQHALQQFVIEQVDFSF